MEILNCIIINPKDFTSAIYKFTKDRNKLPFKDLVLDVEKYSERFLKQLEKLNSYNNKNEFKMLAIKKENSLLNEDIFFNFVISTSKKNKNKDKIERLRVKFLP